MTTLLAGIRRTQNRPQQLERIYNRILHLLKKLPREAAYKIHTEAIICHRLKIVCNAEGDEEEIERNICGGNIDLLISQAWDEYGLLQKVLIWKPWEQLMEKPPPGQWNWPPR